MNSRCSFTNTVPASGGHADRRTQRWSTPPPYSTSAANVSEPPRILSNPIAEYPHNISQLVSTAPKLPIGAPDDSLCYYHTPAAPCGALSLAFRPSMRNFDMESQEEDHQQYYTPQNIFLSKGSSGGPYPMGGDDCSLINHQEQCCAPTNTFLPTSMAEPRAVDDDGYSIISSEDDVMDRA